MSEIESVVGNLRKIRFCGDNGFIIGMFWDGDMEFAGLGNAMNPEEGMSYKLWGRWTEHKTFGKQFNFDFYEQVKPKTTAGIFRYLVRVVKWVGPTIGSRLVNKYGEDTLDLIKTDPARVAVEIKGINLKRVKEMQALLFESEHIEKALIELEQMFAGLGLMKSLPIHLINEYGSDAAQKVKDNPYLLTRFKGIGFLKADKFGLAQGIDRASITRQSAAVIHVIHELMHSEGHTWVAKECLLAATTELLGIDPSPGIDHLLKKETLVKKNACLALSIVDSDEWLIASKVNQLVKNSDIVQCLSCGAVWAGIPLCQYCVDSEVVSQKEFKEI
jgi:exodeoxyribonuclease V alpha subunit